MRIFRAISASETFRVASTACGLLVVPFILNGLVGLLV
jgi:hypothetical protein